MWGFGGRYYWGGRRRESEENGGRREGVVVLFAWMSSEERHVNQYVQLYSSLNWNSLVCHSQFLNMFFPDKAEALAFDIIKVLVEELKVKPCPVVFASFSGGPKSCMYKVLQIMDGICETKLNLDDRQLVRDCLSGFIYDSSPVDFTSDLGARFAVHPTVINMSHPPRVISWMANGIASSLDALFLNRFESHRAEYWQTLYSTITMGAPYLMLCSENDDLAPFHIIHNFAQRLRELGADVKLVKWNGSPHVGHYRHYPIDYKAAVTELLGKATAIYSQRIQKLEGEKMSLEATQDDIGDPTDGLRNAAASPPRSFHGTPLIPSDHFLLPSSLEYYEGRDISSVQDQHKEGLIHLPSPSSSINAHGVLGQILFDVCVPKNVEDWDIRRSSDSLNGRSSRRHTPFNPIKCMRRSRL